MVDIVVYGFGGCQIKPRGFEDLYVPMAMLVD
jgi:hypothetical protein